MYELPLPGACTARPQCQGSILTTRNPSSPYHSAAAAPVLKKEVLAGETITPRKTILSTAPPQPPQKASNSEPPSSTQQCFFFLQKIIFCQKRGVTPTHRVRLPHHRTTPYCKTSLKYSTRQIPAIQLSTSRRTLRVIPKHLSWLPSSTSSVTAIHAVASSWDKQAGETRPQWKRIRCAVIDV